MVGEALINSGEIADGISKSINVGLSIITFVVIILVAVGIAVGIFFLVQYKKRYNIPVTIFDYTTEPVSINHDRAGIVKDKVTGALLLKLKDYKVSLSPDKAPYMLGGSSSGISDEIRLMYSGKGRELFLVRNGKTEFRFWTPPNLLKGDFESSIGPEDVTNAMNQLNRNILLKKYSFKNQLLMYAPLILMAGIFLVIVIIAFKFAPDLMSAQAKLAASNAELVDKMTQLYNAQYGTMVLPGG